VVFSAFPNRHLYYPWRPFDLSFVAYLRRLACFAIPKRIRASALGGLLSIRRGGEAQEHSFAGGQNGEKQQPEPRRSVVSQADDDPVYPIPKQI